MCLDCECSTPGPTRIDGRAANEVKSPVVVGAPKAEPSHTHPHEHAGLGEHSHPHEHTPGQDEMDEPVHSHEQDFSHHHPHRHADGTTHDHGHEHTHSHGHDEAEHSHTHAHDYGHDHPHPHPHPQTVKVNQPILGNNDRLAERNRGFFRAHGLLVLNVLSSPGSGKTTFIQKTATGLAPRLRSAVIVGDLETDNDAARLKAAGATAVQITTGTLCHLEAGMVAKAAGTLDLKALDLLIIENVGNLVCPASFDLGEDLRVVLLSVTEGEDKPLKYPPMFHSAGVVIINKMDLAEAVEFNRDLAVANIRRVSPRAQILEVSAKTGAGMEQWFEFLLAQKAKVRA